MNSEPGERIADAGATSGTGWRGSRAYASAFLLVTAASLAGCDSGTGGSDVGAAPAAPPIARPEILNGGSTGTFREGSEVLLTGKASEDIDGPLLSWDWQQTSGPSVQLIEANSTSVSFTAPAVTAPTNLTFELTVGDSQGQTDRAGIRVMVVPARDSDKFLSLDVATGLTFDNFKVYAVLAGGAATGVTGKPFVLSARAHLAYPPRSFPNADCVFEPADFGGGMPATTAGGCYVEFLADLTPGELPGGGTGIADEWPAKIHAPDESAQAMIERWWNPRYAIDIPRLDVREFNQRFVETGERNRLLDAYNAHRSRIILELSLSAPDNQTDAALIVTDLNDMAVPPADVPGMAGAGSSQTVVAYNAGTGLPTSLVMPLDSLLATIAGRESALTSEVYYRTVDPSDTRTTLNSWLAQAGFTTDTQGTLRPEASAGTGEFARAVYLNNFDLGFGRQMFTRTDEFGNVFSYVKNYRTLEGAIRQLDSFATVVMEYSPLVNHHDPTQKFVKFFTYVDDGSGDEQRVSSFDFDGRGERFTPGNCTTCHGGARPPGVDELVFDPFCGDASDPACFSWPDVNRDGVSIANGNVDALFLPWDLGSLLFADTDPAIIDAPVPLDGADLASELLRDYGDFSRNAQEEQLRKLNQAAFDTYEDPGRTDAVRALVAHWYGGTDAQGVLLSGFDASKAISGWLNGEAVPDPENAGQTLTNPDDAEDIYLNVFGHHCRMCHTSQLDDSLRFRSYQEFLSQQDKIAELVFGSGIMPGARLTMDRLWSPFEGGTAPGSILARHFGFVLGEPPPAPPGAALAVIRGTDPASNRSDTVFLDGGSSVFADSFSWRLTPPAGSDARVVGTSARHPVFAVDLPGTYEIELTINAGTENEATSTALLEATNRTPDAINDIFSLDLVETQMLRAAVNDGTLQDFDADDDELSFAAVIGSAPMYGSVSLQANGNFTYTYTGDVVSPPHFDSFRYTATDAFGESATATVTILLNNAPPDERPSAPALVAVTDDSTAAGAASTFAARISWLASSDDVEVIGYNVYRDAELLEFVPGTTVPGAPVAYTDSGVAPGERYVYRVTALDASNESALSADAAVTIVPSLRRNIQTGWGDGTRSLWQVSGCVGCHRGSPGGLRLFGAADSVFMELHEDQGGPGPYRTDTVEPFDSLLLCKPLIVTHPQGCTHGGGDFLVGSAPAFRMLQRWIEAGTPDN